jgi:integrase
MGASYEGGPTLNIEPDDSALTDTACSKLTQTGIRHIPRIEEVLTEYFKDHPPQSSDWFAKQANLFERYVVPRHGDQWLSRVGEHRWLEVIEKAAIEQRTRAMELHKSLKAFLNYARKRKLLKVNPLARTTLDSLSIRDASSINAAFLKIDHLCAIYEASQKLGPPWGPLFGLAILTGESFADACQVQDRDIDWERHTWTVEWREGPGLTPTPVRIMRLPAEAVEILAQYRNTKGYFFPSPNSLGSPRPISVYTVIIELLRADCGVDGDWTTREIRRAVCREVKFLGNGPDAVSAWSKKFTTHLENEKTCRGGRSGIA